MTAVREQAPPASPRVFVRIAWVLHRAYYRLTGGRRGLWRPKAGAKFGTMRLTTLGRRSGGVRASHGSRLSGTTTTARTWSPWP